MPGPKMGPRPRDFDEELVRRSPTFRKWSALLPGGKLRYACREFVRGHGDDEERLMRRIMIARRNNVRDHQALKWARRAAAKNAEATKVASSSSSSQQPQTNPAAEGGDVSRVEGNNNNNNGGGHNDNGDNSHAAMNHRMGTEHQQEGTLLRVDQELPPGRRARRPTTLISDEAIREEMDFPAVESTRSYKTWMSLPNGAEFLYNQKYIKGHDAHDWLLKKNIWRRMRYRRENKKMVEEMLSREKGLPPSIAQQHHSRKRRHDATIDTSSSAHGNNTSATRFISNHKHNPAIEDLDRIMVDAPSMVLDAATTASSAAAAAAAAAAAIGLTTVTNETNRQDVVSASTASEIVDHALLSTNTGVVVPASPIVPEVNTAIPTINNAITISIGDQHHQDHSQHHNPTHPLHQHQHQHQHHLHHHNQHDHNQGATESAAAFAASIALAGVGIGTDGDLVGAHHEAAVADSAAVEAAVAAALAATDVKSNSYHEHHQSHLHPSHHHEQHHHHHHPVVNHHHIGLMNVNHVVHESSHDPLQPSETTNGAGLVQMKATADASSAISIVAVPTNAVPPPQQGGTTNHPAGVAPPGGVVTGLGLALDAAARLAAAAAATTCSNNAEEAAVLAATKAITAATVTAETASIIEPASLRAVAGGMNNNNNNIGNDGFAEECDGTVRI